MRRARWGRAQGAVGLRGQCERPASALRAAAAPASASPGKGLLAPEGRPGAGKLEHRRRTAWPGDSTRGLGDSGGGPRLPGLTREPLPSAQPREPARSGRGAPTPRVSRAGTREPACKSGAIRQTGALQADPRAARPRPVGVGPLSDKCDRGTSGSPQARPRHRLAGQSETHRPWETGQGVGGVRRTGVRLGLPAAAGQGAGVPETEWARGLPPSPRPTPPPPSRPGKLLEG